MQKLENAKTIVIEAKVRRDEIKSQRREVEVNKQVELEVKKVRVVELKSVEDTAAKRIKDEVRRRNKLETERQRQVEAEWRNKIVHDANISYQENRVKAFLVKKEQENIIKKKRSLEKDFR